MRKWYPVTLIVVASVASALAYANLPDRVPTHWNVRGQVDGTGTRLQLSLLLPTLILVLWPLLRLLPTIDPRRANFAKFQDTYDLVVNLILTILVVIHLALLGVALGLPIDIARVIPAGLGLMLVVIGNLLPRARSNWWFGIRTPWTLSSDRVWERTHRVGGYLLAAAGLVIVAASFLRPPILGTVVAIAIGGAALASVVYSYIAWKEESSR